MEIDGVCKIKGERKCILKCFLVDKVFFVECRLMILELLYMCIGVELLSELMVRFFIDGVEGYR